MSKSTFRGHGYFTSYDLREKKDELEEYYVHTPGWVVREGHVREWFVSILLKDASLLDIGASGGDMLRQFIELGFTNLHGTDLVDYATKRLPKLIDFKTCDLNRENLPWPDASFDAVASLSVAEHLENPFHFFREARRVLKPGGLFAVSIPNAFHIWSRLTFLRRGDLTDWNEENAHISVMTKAVFHKTVLSFFEIQDRIYEQGFLPYFPKIKMPRTEFFGRRVCYLMRKRG